MDEDNFSILSSWEFDDLIFLHTLSFLSASCICRVLLTCHSVRSRKAANGKLSIARWILTAERAGTLLSLSKSGDFSPAVLADKDDASLTLERLHLFERPPRFPTVYFQFGSDELSWEDCDALSSSVSSLLFRHRSIKIAVEGRVQPDAPLYIKSLLSFRRAEMASIVICEVLCRQLFDEAMEKEPDRDEVETLAGIRAQVKERVKPVGKSSEPVTNENFIKLESELLQRERNEENYEDWGRVWRRVDITVTSL